jgi:hypothetical protein
MIPPLIELVDWALDATALLLALALAASLLGLSARDVAVAGGCCVVYGAHEAWEAAVIGGGTHRAFEWWVHGVVAVGAA